MVTARSFGPLVSAARQRAASTINAVESGPPETASTNADAELRPSNSDCASAAEIGASSAADALLLTFDALPDRDFGTRVLALHFGERRTGGFTLAQRRQRLAETE